MATLCVTNSTVVPCSAVKRRSSAGRIASARAIATRCCCPPLRLPAP
jgi:hypothetical protein